MAIVFILSVQASVYSQVDSLFIAPLKEKKSLTYGLNNRGTFLLQDRITIYGAYLGVQYGRRLKHVITINANPFWAGKNNEQVRLAYIGLAEEYSFWFVNRFEFVTYIHGGIGVASYRIKEPLGAYKITNDWISPVELGLHSAYHVNDWLSFKAGAGYRFVLFDGANQLNNVYYKLGVGIKLENLVEKHCDNSM